MKQITEKHEILNQPGSRCSCVYFRFFVPFVPFRVLHLAILGIYVILDIGYFIWLSCPISVIHAESTEWQKVEQIDVDRCMQYTRPTIVGGLLSYPLIYQVAFITTMQFMLTGATQSPQIHPSSFSSLLPLKEGLFLFSFFRLAPFINVFTKP